MGRLDLGPPDLGSLTLGSPELGSLELGSPDLESLELESRDSLSPEVVSPDLALLEPAQRYADALLGPKPFQQPAAWRGARRESASTEVLPGETMATATPGWAWVAGGQ